MSRERVREKVEKDGGGREMDQTDVELIPRLRRNAPATPHRYKEEEKRGRFQEKRWKRRGNLHTKKKSESERSCRTQRTSGTLSLI